jgi:hypothetical protein
MKWPQGFKMPAHLPHALDARSRATAQYFHPDEVRDYIAVQQGLRTMRDIRRATRGGIIAEAIPSGQLAYGLHPQPARRAPIDRTPLEVQALRHEILHAIHEQRTGLPKTIVQFARSEWAAHSGSLLGKHGRKAGGSWIARFIRALLGTVLLTLRQMVAGEPT